MGQRRGPILGLAAVVSCGQFAAAGSDRAGAVDAGGSEGGANVECRARPMASWSKPRRLELQGAAAQAHFVDPFVTADGLTLLFGTNAGDERLVYRTQRASRTAAWDAPVKVEGFGNPSYCAPYPSSARSEEIVVAIPWAAASLEIGALVRQGDRWSTVHFGELERPDADFSPTISADGTMLIFTEFGANADNPFRILYQATRLAPSSAWGDKRELHRTTSAGKSTLPADFDWPAPTPDGLGLFYSDAGEEEKPVHYVSRKQRDAPFFDGSTAPVVLEALTAPGFATRVRSITADGCELYLTSNRDGIDDSYVAFREP